MTNRKSEAVYADEPDRLSQSSRASDINSFPMDLIQDDAPDGKQIHPDEMDNAMSLGLILETPIHGPENASNRLEEQDDKSPSRCAQCCNACMLRCRPCMTEHNPLPSSATISQRIRYACMCPPHGKVARGITLLLAVVFFWGMLWGITGKNALPGGNLFALMVLVILCMKAGAIVKKMRLPGLLGMLIVGCALRNVPVVNVAKNIDIMWSSTLRSMALVVILTRAGLGLDFQALKKLSFGVIRLAFIPCLMETLTEAVAAHLILGFPWVWGFMLGFVLAAVSPAVVVPSMISLESRRYGVNKGIPTLVIAAASVDDVLAISGFGVVLGIAFSTGGIALAVVKGPLEAVAGVVFGVVFGIVLWYIPHKKNSSIKLFQFVLLFCGGLFAMFGSHAADVSGAGPLAVLTLAFIAGLAWRKECGQGKQMAVARYFATLWVLFEPLLFGLIGAEVNLSLLQPQTIGNGVAVLCCGLCVRIIASFLAVFRLGLNWKEKFFIPVAWLPKATVQAAIGGLALSTAQSKLSDPTEVTPELELGRQVLTIAVLSIILTAPLGAVAIALTGPRLLAKTPDRQLEVHVPENIKSNEMNKLNGDIEA